MLQKSKYNFERGSMAIYAIVTIVFFMIVITAVFTLSSSVRENQLKTLIKIKEIYSKKINESDINAYVTEGLILHFDGINNTGNGHSTTTTTWKDLSGNGNDGTLSKAPNSNFYWDNNNITLSGVSSSLGTYVDTPVNLNGKERTIFYTIDANNLAGSIWGDTDSSNTNGLFNYCTFVANRGNSASTQNRYSYTFAKSGIYNYAVTLSATSLKFYVNGVLTNTTTNTIGLKTSNNLRILAAYYTSQNATNLKLYNFMVYDRALTDAEVLQNYQIDKSTYGF